MNYRNSMQITADLLEITQSSGNDGIRTTSLIQKANLSHSRLQKLIFNLTNSGLVTQFKSGGGVVHVITPKGMLFLDEYSKFREFANSYGLEL